MSKIRFFRTDSDLVVYTTTQQLNLNGLLQQPIAPVCSKVFKCAEFKTQAQLSACASKRTLRITTLITSLYPESSPKYVLPVASLLCQRKRQ